MSQTPSVKPLRWPEMLGYGVGEVGFGFYWKVFALYLTIFYTDVFGISPAAVGTLMLASRISDTITDPIMGMIADRTKTRWGKFRPFLLWMSVPMAAAGVLTFTTPNLEGGAKIAYAYATYIFMMAMYTAANIPYGAILGVITPDVQQRTTVSTFKLVSAFAAGAIVAFGAEPTAVWLGGGDMQRGWQRAMVLAGILAVAFLYIAFRSVRERVAPEPKQKNVVGRDLRDLLRNGPWLVLLTLGFVVILTISIRDATFAYYMKYYAGRPDLVNTFVGWTQVPLALGAICTPFVTKRIGKKRLFIILMLIVAALSAALFFVPRDAISAMFMLAMLISFVLGPKSVLTWAMFGDAADYSEWTTGRRATGLVYAAATSSVKLGTAIAGAIVGFLLDAVGYVANQEQTETALNGIVALVSVIPGGFALLAAAVILLYKLDGETLDRVQRELKERRNAASPSSDPAATEQPS